MWFEWPMPENHKDKNIYTKRQNMCLKNLNILESPKCNDIVLNSKYWEVNGFRGLSYPFFYFSFLHSFTPSFLSEAFLYCGTCNVLTDFSSVCFVYTHSCFWWSVVLNGTSSDYKSHYLNSSIAPKVVKQILLFN